MNVKQYNAILPWWELLLLRIHHYQGTGPDDYRPAEWTVAAAIYELAEGLSDKAARKTLQDVSGKVIGAHFSASAR